MRHDIFAALAFGAAVALAAPFTEDSTLPQVLRTRNIVEEISDSYDFVVVGGGLAGLVLGARLSEDKNHTVLVLEAGSNGDEYRQRIDTPAYSYFESLWPTPLNWNFNTTPQAYANNSELPWPRGKVLGGSSAINGLYMNRPGEIEVNAWQEMLGDMDGADSWSWDSFYAAMKKSETFTPPTAAVAQEAGITWDASSHGTKGPIHMSYPGYTFPLVKQWLEATDNQGVANSDDTYGGKNWGAYVANSAINPSNWTRSYSRSGYLDPLPPRPNYDVLANAHVTRLLFNSSSPKGNLSANAVEYTRDNGATKMIVKVKKEVILAGGTIGSPAVLLYSGVGPKDVLSSAGVMLVHELPGVGQHLQDHLSATIQFSTDQATAGSLYASNGTETYDPAFLSYINSAVAYVNASVLFGNAANGLHSSIKGQVNQFTSLMTTDAGVVAGNEAIYTTTADKIFTSPLGLVELLIGNNNNGTVNIGAALQHPYSFGRIYINSSNPVDYPVIDPNYLVHPADVQTLREGLKLVRRIGESGPLKSSLSEEIWPGKDVQTDDEWDEWLRGSVFTEFHPSSTCAMLPLKQGGVVDANLRVYGLANVRVADASVPPISFSAHLMASTYGLAEQASDIIRAYHNRPILKSSNTTTSSNRTSTGDNDSDQQSSGNSNGNTTGESKGDPNGSVGLTLHPWPVFLAMATCIASMFLL